MTKQTDYRAELMGMPMDRIRQLGYDLEPLVGRELRSHKKTELVDQVMGAVHDAGKDGAKLVIAALEAWEAAGDEAAAETVREENAGGEPATARKRPARPALPEGAVAPFVQVLCHPGTIMHSVYYGDVLANPDEETFRLVTKKLAHQILTRDEAEQVVRSRKGRLNRQLSRLKDSSDG